MARYYGLIMPTVFPTGLFIQRIEQTQKSTESGGKNIITATLTNHTQQNFEIYNGQKGDKGDTGKAANIKKITATVDNSIGNPQVTVSETGDGSDKTVAFEFSGLKGERGDVFINEEVKNYIQSQLPVMPANPVAYYDFSNAMETNVISPSLKNFSKTLTAASNDALCYFYNNNFNHSLKKGVKYILTADFTVIKGKPTHATILYYDLTTNKTISQNHTPITGNKCKASFTFTYTPIEGHNIQLLFYSGKAGHTNGIHSTWSNFNLETLADTQIIDASGNGVHSIFTGALLKTKHDTLGHTVFFEKGSISRPPSDFIGVGKTWSHSRWIKIDPDKQNVQTNPRLWEYGKYDYAFFDIKVYNGILSHLAIATYRNSNSYIWSSIGKERFFNNEWHHLVVMIDLQESYVKKIIYLDGEKIFDRDVKADFKDWQDSEKTYVDMSTGQDYTVGSLAHLMFFDRMLTEQEILWLYRNPQYPIKHYTKTDARLLELFKNGYIQWNEMQTPDSVFHQTGYRWSKLHTYETHVVWKLEKQ